MPNTIYFKNILKLVDSQVSTVVLLPTRHTGSLSFSQENHVPIKAVLIFQIKNISKRLDSQVLRFQFTGNLLHKLIFYKEYLKT